MLTKRTRGQWCLLIAGGLLLVWSMMPAMADGVFGIGAALPGAVALLMLWGGLRRPGQQPLKGWKKRMAILGMVLVCVVALVGAVITGLMLHSATTTPADNATVIVLGSKIHGDQPSRMMRDRLSVAAAYLREHPGANCVVTGGLGPGETYTEAYVMKKYLVEQEGIDPDRIACEERATDTHENLHFSMEIIRQRGWSTHVAVATQVFHQYRADRLAVQAGASSVGGLACLTPFHLTLNYWTRECAAICRLWLTGY